MQQLAGSNTVIHTNSGCRVIAETLKHKTGLHVASRLDAQNSDTGRVGSCQHQTCSPMAAQVVRIDLRFRASMPPCRTA